MSIDHYYFPLRGPQLRADSSPWAHGDVIGTHVAGHRVLEAGSLVFFPTGREGAFRRAQIAPQIWNGDAWTVSNSLCALTEGRLVKGFTRADTPHGQQR